jgi:hypothetical protein
LLATANILRYGDDDDDDDVIVVTIIWEELTIKTQSTLN